MRGQPNSRLRGTFKLHSRVATVPVVTFSSPQSLPKTDPGPMKTQRLRLRGYHKSTVIRTTAMVNNHVWEEEKASRKHAETHFSLSLFCSCTFMPRDFHSVRNCNG